MPCLIELVTLFGQHAWLEPLDLEHEDEVCAAAADGELWKLWHTSVPSSDKTGERLAIVLDMRERLGAMPFVVCDMCDGQPGKVVGTTRLFNVDEINHRLKIGHTWYAKPIRRVAVNTERKLLLLTHTFEALRRIAVELRTHWMNHQNRAAIARLGAEQDDVLHNHQRMPDGSFRDTVVFSIIESEWLTVKHRLQYKLEQPRV